jgi:hypothetical protein
MVEIISGIMVVFAVLILGVLAIAPLFVKKEK